MANPKPLRSANAQPQDVQFKHFGVLDSGAQSKTSMFTSITVNVILALIIVIIGAATKKISDQHKLDKISYVVPLKEKPPPPPKPIKPPPPPKIPPIPPKEILKPVILRPEVKIPDPPKVVVKEIPKPPTPVVVPAPPKLIVAAAAPKVVAVNMAKSATIANHDLKPTTVDMGHPDSPVPSKTGPAVSNVRLNAGMAGMPPNAGGRGPVGVTSLGSGQPTGSIGGRGVVAVAGVPHGLPGGTGNGPGNGLGRTPPQQVQMGETRVAQAAPVQIAKASTKTPPTVTFKPSPVYTEEARSQHIEGAVRVHIHVTASGQVQVIGVVSGLGHGLDQSAMQVCQGMKFKPAIDSNGNPTDWDGNVTVSFQLA